MRVRERRTLPKLFQASNGIMNSKNSFLFFRGVSKNILAPIISTNVKNQTPLTDQKLSSIKDSKIFIKKLHAKEGDFVYPDMVLVECGLANSQNQKIVSPDYGFIKRLFVKEIVPSELPQSENQKENISLPSLEASEPILCIESDKGIDSILESHAIQLNALRLPSLSEWVPNLKDIPSFPKIKDMKLSFLAKESQLVREAEPLYTLKIYFEKHHHHHILLPQTITLKILSPTDIILWNWVMLPGKGQQIKLGDIVGYCVHSSYKEDFNMLKSVFDNIVNAKVQSLSKSATIAAERENSENDSWILKATLIILTTAVTYISLVLINTNLV